MDENQTGTRAKPKPGSKTKTCLTCDLQTIPACDPATQEWFELVEVPGEFYGVRAERIELLGTTTYINVPYPATAWRRHTCNEAPVVLGQAVKALGVELGSELGRGLGRFLSQGSTQSTQGLHQQGLADPAPGPTHFPKTLGEPA